MISRWAPAIVVVLILGGCAMTPQQQPSAKDPAFQPSHRQAKQASLRALNTWKLEGRIALYNEVEAWNADLHWRQRGEHYEIRLVGPFGQGRIRVHGDTHGVVMETSDRRYFDQDPDVLFNRRLGWNIPINALKWWIRGLPAQGLSMDAEPTWDNQGRLTRLRQDGWDIHFKRYAAVGALELPGKVFLENAQWNVRLVIQDWRITTR